MFEMMENIYVRDKIENFSKISQKYLNRTQDDGFATEVVFILKNI